MPPFTVAVAETGPFTCVFQSKVPEVVSAYMKLAPSPT
jgi:hypothetical protein